MAIIDNEKYLLSGSQIKKITTEIQSKADAENVYTKTETDALLNDKADKATTLEGYGIEDAYTKTEIDSKLDDCIKGVKVNSTPLTPDENGVVNVETLVFQDDEIEHSVSINNEDLTSSFYILPNTTGAQVQIVVNEQAELRNLVDKTYVDTEVDKKKITLSPSTDIDLSFSGTVSDTDKSIAVNLLNTGDSATADITVSGEDSKSISVPSVAKMNKAILDALGEITEIEIEVVDQLPATGVKGVFYFVPVTGSTTPDLYDEYVWVTPENEDPHFELIGSTRVDLSNYYDKDETDNLLNLKADKTELTKYMRNKSTADTFDIEDSSGRNVLKVVDNTAGVDVTVKTDEDPYGGLDFTKTLTDIRYVDNRLGEKQDALNAGENITIENNVISATGDTTYTAGNGLVLTDTEFSADTTVLATQTDLADGLALKADKTELDDKQDVLTAGSNISIVIDDNTGETVISATDTTYTAGTGLALNDTEFSIDSTVVATKTDLDDYYTKTEVDNLIPDVTGFITKDVNDLTYYTTTADLEAALDLKADKTELDSYYTKTETNALLEQKSSLAITPAGVDNYKAEITQGNETFRVDEPTNSLIDIKWIDTDDDHNVTVSVPTKEYVDNAVNNIEEATNDVAGLIKLNIDEAIALDENGRLTIGGRMGQFPGGGMYYPLEAVPTQVGQYSLLITDGAKGLKVTPRSFCIMAGAVLNCRTAAAGATQYRVLNSRANRFTCLANSPGNGGRLALSQADAALNGTVAITSIALADGSPLTFDFGRTDPSNDIIITVEKSANPKSTTSSLRLYGTTLSNDVVAMGQNVTAFAKGVAIGQSCKTEKQQTMAVGNSVIVTDVNSFGFGNTIYVPTQYSFATGYMQDLSQASNGTSVFGMGADVKGDTALAIGNGGLSSDTLTKSNAFEVKKTGKAIASSMEINTADGIILTSPNGTKYKLTVDDSGNLSTIAVT